MDAYCYIVIMGAAQSTLANVEELSPKIARNMQKRLKISQEVVETEKNYSQSIDTCIQVCKGKRKYGN